MKKIHNHPMRICFALLVVFAHPVTVLAACASEFQGRVYSTSTIDLQARDIDESFYFRVGHYVILVERAAFTKRLEDRSKKYGMPNDSRLLNDIVDAKAAGKYVDLFAFALRNPAYLQRLELTLADMLASGAASIVDVDYLPNERGRFVSAIVLLKFGTGPYEARRFCTSSGDLLLEITDRIA